MMPRLRQLAAMAAACSKPTSPWSFLGIASYSAYLAILARGGIDGQGTTGYIPLLFAAATLGAWLGGCARRMRSWPNAILVPGYAAATTGATLGIGAAGLGCGMAVAWIGGLDIWPLATIGTLALSASLIAGLLLPRAASYLHIGMWAAALLAAGWRRDALCFACHAPIGAWAAATLAASGALLFAFASLQRFGSPRRRLRRQGGGSGRNPRTKPLCTL